MTLAPHAVKLNSQQSAQFYVPDGKYRMQVFALEDLRDGNVNVYCGDVLKDALAAGVLTAPKKGAEPNTYKLGSVPTRRWWWTPWTGTLKILPPSSRT